MKKTYKIDVDCANCANKMEDAANKTPGVKSAVVNFMTLKMHVEFEEGQDPKSVMTAAVDISFNRSRRTSAFLHIWIITAFAGIHGSDKDKISRIFIRAVHAH